MIYSLRGEPQEFIQPNRLILKTNFLTWEVLLPLRTFEGLKKDKPQSELVLFVVLMLVKDELFRLYGFERREERELFLKLNRLYRVGPILSLNILSYFTPEDLKDIVVQRRVGDLAKVPGIGLKKAERLILDLKGLFERVVRKGVVIPEPMAEILMEAKDCLVSLGFTAKEAESAILKVYHEGDTLEEILKKSLRELAPA